MKAFVGAHRFLRIALVTAVLGAALLGPPCAPRALAACKAADGRPPNDHCCSATEIRGARYVGGGDTSQSGADDADPSSLTCRSGIGSLKPVWYRYVAPHHGTVTIEAFGSGFDALVAVFTGTCPDPIESELFEFQCDNDGGDGDPLTFPVTAGSDYRIMVSAPPGDPGGAFTLSLQFMSVSACGEAAGSDCCYRFADSLTPFASDPPHYSFVDVASTGTRVSLRDDEVSPPIHLGFSFRFYDATRTEASVSSNGFLILGDETHDGCCPADPVPHCAAPNGMIAGFWTDLNPEPAEGGGGAIYYDTLGSAPDRRFVVQFDDVPKLVDEGSDPHPTTWEIILHEGTNEVLVQYRDAQSGPKAVSLGIENGDGCRGVQWMFGAQVALGGVAVRYEPVTLDCDQCRAAGTCNPTSGVCTNPPVANGRICSDDNLCTQADTCQDGFCTGGTPLTCDDGNVCTADSCDPASGCQTTLVVNGAPCDDGAPCDGHRTCQAGLCTCSDGDEPCGNGIVAGAEQCEAGPCCNPSSCTFKAAGTPCPDDGSVCTDDVCDGTRAACAHPHNTAACNDGNACTRTDACRSGVCVGGNLVPCPAPDVCHEPGDCDPLTGLCINLGKPDDTVCNNGNGCQSDSCRNGQCLDAGECELFAVPEVTELPNEKAPIPLTCQSGAGEQKASCQAQGWVPASLVASLPHSRDRKAPRCKNVENGLCSITNKARKRIKQRTGEAVLKLKLNKIGRYLLQEKGTVDSVVRVTRSATGKPATALEYLVRLIRAARK
jgi:hypothetical protein